MPSLFGELESSGIHPTLIAPSCQTANYVCLNKLEICNRNGTLYGKVREDVDHESHECLVFYIWKALELKMEKSKATLIKMYGDIDYEILCTNILGISM